MKKNLNYIILVLIILVFSSLSFGKNYRNKNVVIKESKTINLKRNNKGHILYLLKKGRYKITLTPNTVDYVDSYIMGEAQEVNPSAEENRYVYELDTNKNIEIFKQEYQVNKNFKLKIEIQKIE